MEMVKLPKGVTVEINRQKYGGDVEIPASICPEKHKPKPSGSSRRNSGNKDKGSEGGADE